MEPTCHHDEWKDTMAAKLTATDLADQIGIGPKALRVYPCSFHRRRLLSGSPPETTVMAEGRSFVPRFLPGHLRCSPLAIVR